MNLMALLQIIVAIVLSAVILLQTKGTGLGLAFGGTGEEYRSKRGIERVLFLATIVLSIIFLSLSLVGVTVR